jgi:hypothetical protein
MSPIHEFVVGNISEGLMQGDEFEFTFLARTGSKRSPSAIQVCLATQLPFTSIEELQLFSGSNQAQMITATRSAKPDSNGWYTYSARATAVFPARYFIAGNFDITSSLGFLYCDDFSMVPVTRDGDRTIRRTGQH